MIPGHWNAVKKENFTILYKIFCMNKVITLLLVLIVFNNCNKSNVPVPKKQKTLFQLRMDSIDIAVLQENQALFSKIESEVSGNAQAKGSVNAEKLTDQILLCSIQLNKGDSISLDQAINLGNSIMATVETEFGNNSDEYTKLKLITAWAYGYSGNLEQERKMTNELISSELAQSNPDVMRLADYHNTIGDNYMRRGETLNELINFRKALDYQNQIPDIQNDFLAYQSLINNYNSICQSYLNAQDYVNALFYATKCVEERTKSGVFTPQIAINYMAIGRSKFGLSHNKDTAMYYLNKAISILESSGMKNSPPWVSYQGHIADIEIQAGETQAGIIHMSSIINEFKLSDNPEVINVTAGHYYKIIKALIQTNQIAIATQKSNEAIAYVNQHQNVLRPYVISLIRSTEAQLLSKNKQWQKAETIFDNELKANAGSISKLMSQEGIPYHTPQNVIPVYSNYANMLLSRANETNSLEEKLNLLRNSINSYKKIISYYNNRESFYSNQNLNQSVTLDKNEQVSIFENCLTALNSELEMAQSQPNTKLVTDSIYQDIYSIMESSKANVLQMVLKNEEAFTNLLPVEVNDERKQKAKELDSLGVALRKNFDVKSELELQRKFNEYNTWLENTANKYHVPYQNIGVEYSISDFSKAEPNNLICNYFLGRNSLFCLSTINGKQSFTNKEIPTDFIKQLEYINTQYLSGDNINNITNESSAMAKEIFKKWYALLIDDNLLKNEFKEIVIIPSRQLHKIPFDLLIDSSNSYLIQSKPIRYELSGAMICKSEQPKGGKGFAGFAASNFKFLQKESDKIPAIAVRGNNLDLPHTASEVDELSQLTNGNSYKNTTPRVFKSNAGEYGIIHISTHSFASNNILEDNYLAFEQDKDAKDYVVTSNDIQKMGLNANFCMLASCESGSGYIDDKEGAMSIGKSFIEAGVPSVGISFWKLAESKSTVALISDFYSNLKQGMTKAEAMQKAKLKYLTVHKDGAENLPFYWAGLAIIGNNNSISFDEHSNSQVMNILLYSLAAALGLLLIYFISRKRKSA